MDLNSDYFIGDVSGLVERTNRIIDFCRERSYKIIFITHVEKDSDGVFAENSENVKIISDLHKEETDVLVVKNKISAFYKTNLEEVLRGVDEIVVCGVLTNLCVRGLVQDAYDRELKITVINDCCQAFDKKIHEFTIKDLKETREEINFLDLKDFISDDEY
ncbi:MAG: isochorismatase family cysteine hydrolase [Nanoarchaeota archaeon]|nr:isochorismatase family cysteine hydrolase [Nanoarchaeota archaeon]